VGPAAAERRPNFRVRDVEYHEVGERTVEEDGGVEMGSGVVDDPETIGKSNAGVRVSGQKVGGSENDGLTVAQKSSSSSVELAANRHVGGTGERVGGKEGRR